MTASTEESLLRVIRAALDQTRAAACITTADLDSPGPIIVYVNAAYCFMTGRSVDEVIGLSPRFMQGPLTSRSVLDRLRSDLEAGRPFIGETVNYRKNGEPYLNSWRIDPVLDEAGVTTHFIATQGDITEIRRAQRLLDAEKTIDRQLPVLLSGPGDPEANLTRLAEDISAAVGGLVDYGQVALSCSVRLGTTAIQLRAGAATPAEEIVARLSGASGASGACQVGGTEDGHWVGCSLSNSRAGIDGLVAVIGLTAAELDFTDRRGLERLSECAGRALESLAEYERQRLLAVELQRDLLPAGEPSAPGFRVAARYHPAAFAAGVGGDWYDVIPHGEGVVLIVGDMAGSGIRAAADMGRVRLLTRALLSGGAEVPEVLGELNRFCAEENLMATALAISADPTSGSMTMVTAGHPPPVIRREPGAEVLSLTPGPPLGIGGDVTYPSRSVAVEAGEIVVMFTDGLVERRDEGIDLSIRKLADRVTDLPAAVTPMVDGLLTVRVADDPTDDIALLAFETDRNTQAE